MLFLTLLLCLALTPRPWQELLRQALVWEADRHKVDLTIGRMEGGPFDTLRLYDVHARQRGVSPASGGGTDLRIARVELTPDWSFSRRDAHRSWLRRLTVEGLTGRCDLTPAPALTGAASPASKPHGWLGRNLYRFVPQDFFVRADGFQVRRGRYHVQTRNLRLSGDRTAPGLLLVREVEIGGPGFQNTFLNRHGETLWQGNRLTITGMELAPGVRLASFAADGTHLGRRRVEATATLTVLGGEVRAQGAANLSRTHLGLEIAGTLKRLPLQSVARLVGLIGSAGGEIEQGNFSFRGDPENPLDAEMWLAAQATDFRWGRRRWQSLELQTVVLHRRVQVNRLELRQSQNLLSLKGEFPLPAQVADGKPPTAGHWWDAGFSCVVDARLEDLRALATLVGPRFPALDGRMSVNGTLESLPGRPGIDGYLNVEGSGLKVRTAPLDFLRSTLVFRGEEMEVADLQITHAGDYLTGKWTARLAGKGSYEGRLKVAVADRSVYTPALEGWLDLNRIGLGSEDPKAPLNLDGTFRGPGPQGEVVFQDNGTTTEPLRVPAPTVGDWWKDD